MIGAPDLLVTEPDAGGPTRAARVRRVAAATLATTAAVLGGTTVLTVTGWTVPGVADAASGWTAPASAAAATTAPPSAAGGSPSELVAMALASPWRLVELSLRPDGHASAVLAARFEAPHGRPARPEELVVSMSAMSLSDLAPVAIVATAEGTAVDVAGRLALDTRRRTGAPVPVATLAGGISRDVTGAGGRVRGVRAMVLDDGGAAASVAFDAAPEVAVAVLAALEEGVSSPARMTGLLVRRAEDVLAVELTLTPRALARAVP